MHIPSSEMAKAQTFAAAARNIAVLSGAGLSKASGIPTYRDTDGLWQNTQALKYASIEAYQADPGSFHHFWRARRRELRRAHPNAAHIALRELQRKNRLPLSLKILTACCKELVVPRSSSCTGPWRGPDAANVADLAGAYLTVVSIVWAICVQKSSYLERNCQRRLFPTLLKVRSTVTYFCSSARLLSWLRRLNCLCLPLEQGPSLSLSTPSRRVSRELDPGGTS